MEDKVVVDLNRKVICGTCKAGNWEEHFLKLREELKKVEK